MKAISLFVLHFHFNYSSLPEHRASLAAIVVSVSPSCIKMELSRAISSGDLSLAIQQARAEMAVTNSQDCMLSPQSNICRNQWGKNPGS